MNLKILKKLFKKNYYGQIKMHGLLKKMNLKKNMDSYIKLMSLCTIGLLNINKGKIICYKFYREKAYNKTV